MKATRKNLKKGFTLVELVIVIAVIAILAAVLIPTFSSVIKNANNSADQQLVSQLNLIGAMHQADDKNNEFEFADNIRKMLEDEGIKKDSLVTKNKDTIIVYNTQTNKFERCELDDDDLVVSDSAAYYLEEIFENRIIISTGGNALAEAIYALHNIPGGDETTDHPSGDKATDHVQKAYKKIPENLQEAVKNALEGAVIIDKGGDAVSIDFSGGEPKVVSATKGTKVIFSEAVNQKFNFGTGDYMPAKVIIPNNVKSVKGTLGAIKFAGNTAVVEGIDANHICTIAQARGLEPVGPYYKKVTSTNELVSGAKYLIVYETGSLAFDGSLATLDVAKNSVSVTIDGGKIVDLQDIANSYFTIDKLEDENYTIRSASGYYIGRSANSNGLSTSTSATANYCNTITFDEEGNVKIKGVSEYYLKYNSASGDNNLRFRYYGSDQQDIQLYIFVDDTTNPVEPEPGETKTYTWKLVTSTDNLDGAKILFAFNEGTNVTANGKVDKEKYKLLSVTGLPFNSGNNTFTTTGTSDVEIWTVAKNGDDWTFANSAGSLLNSGSSTNLSTGTSNNLWKISVDDGGTAEVVNLRDDSRLILFQAGEVNGFGYYASSNAAKSGYHKIQIYMLVED